MTLYPSELPTEEIKDVISVIKTGTIIDDKVKFAKAVWTIEGYALNKAFGELPIAFSSMPPLSNDQVVGLLESTLEQSNNPSIMQAIPWLTIAKWSLQILASLL